MESKFFGKDGLIWWKGVVEDRKDPIMLGRVRVRIFGWHTEDKAQMPTETLPWAIPSLPGDNGRNVVGYKEGDWCWGFFLDGLDAQKPIVVGFIPGIDTNAADPEKGFNDPTPDDQLLPGAIPRPPEMAPPTLDDPADAILDLPGGGGGRFKNTDSIPGSNLAFGEKLAEFDINKSKFDVNKDGTYNEADAQTIIEINKKQNDFFSGSTTVAASFPVSRYPLENRLKEPMTSRLARNEKIEETIVAAKNGTLGVGEGAGYTAQDGGAESPGLPFMEPQSPYAAVYPYNHVYESESGHVVEVDDTPGAERMHWYHRAGTFTEIHPTGTEVNRVVKKQYNFVYEDYFLASGVSINMDAKDAFRMKSGTDMNRVVGGNMNAEVSNNYHLTIGSNGYVYAKGGVLYIKAVGDISIESADGAVEIKSPKAVSLSAPDIHLQGHTGGEATIHLVSSDIKANKLYAHEAKTTGREPEAPEDFEGIENDADKKADAAMSSKEGFMLPTGQAQDLWKPISDSTGNLVTLSIDTTPHQIYEALPTGQLEAVIIKYKHPDMTETQWEVVRPVHIRGEFIASPKSSPVQFEDTPRFLQRWDRPGGQFPQQVFWVTGTAEHLILDSSVRHMTWVPFNDKLPMPPLSPPAPEVPETPAAPGTPETPPTPVTPTPAPAPGDDGGL